MSAVMTTLARTLFVERQSLTFAMPMATGITLAAERTKAPGASKLLTFFLPRRRRRGGHYQHPTQVSTETSSWLSHPRRCRLRRGLAGDSDAYTVTFSGEAANTGGGFWEIRGQASLNGGVTFFDIDPVD